MIKIFNRQILEIKYALNANKKPFCAVDAASDAPISRPRRLIYLIIYNHLHSKRRTPPLLHSTPQHRAKSSAAAVYNAFRACKPHRCGRKKARTTPPVSSHWHYCIKIHRILICRLKSATCKRGSDIPNGRPYAAANAVPQTPQVFRPRPLPKSYHTGKTTSTEHTNYVSAMYAAPLRSNRSGSRHVPTAKPAQNEAHSRPADMHDNFYAQKIRNIRI